MILKPLILACFWLSVVQSSCPNHCNNKGMCDKFSRCTCAAGFQGADCSQRTCPFGLAWSDEAVETDVAHRPAECSNRGICNRQTGKCKCMEGFTGTSCERLSCSQDCHGKGICLSMSDYAAGNLNEMSVQYEYNDVWDAEKLKGCECDNGLSGYDCSLTDCPVGDDPLTTGQKNEVQLFTCVANQGSFTLYYNGKPSSTLAWNANALAVAAALEDIPELDGGVKVTFSQSHGTVCQLHKNVVSVEFTQEFGPQNPLVAKLDTTMSESGGAVTVSGDGETSITDVSGVTYTSVKGTKENDACAGRGMCNQFDGTCSCYDTNGDRYDSSNGYGVAGTRGDCGYVLSSTNPKGVSTCPGDIQCSGHGICDQKTFRCLCSAGWESGDCSEKSCPKGKAWFGYPAADNSAHTEYEECSNMGLCDHATGSCVCRKGFYGQACEYMSCGGGTDNPCSGHGRCMTMAELALWANNNGDATDLQYGSDPNNPLTWDYDRIHGCHCDPGYSGYDCSQVDCPVGDDPGTYDDHVEVQLLRCIADAGNFTLSFRQAVTPPLPWDIDAAGLRAALVALPTIYNINVYFTQDGNTPEGVLDYVLPRHEPAVDGTPDWYQFFPGGPTYAPTLAPTTFSPSIPAASPTRTPTQKPSLSPSLNPSQSPSLAPTEVPSMTPTTLPGPTPSPSLNAHSLCRIDGTQLAIIEFLYTHGDVPALIANGYNLGDYTHYNGEPNTGYMNVTTNGQKVLGVQSIRGTTEVDVCNNRGICDTRTGLCQCFPTWSSSDGARQGGPGDTHDCGYRNDKLYSSFDSYQPVKGAGANQ